MIPCLYGELEGVPGWAAAGAYGSILPAVWSFQLALRSRGLGSVFTTLHLPHADQAAELLGIPAGVTQAALDPGRLLHRRRLQARGAAADGGDHLLERVEADALTRVSSTSTLVSPSARSVTVRPSHASAHIAR